MATVKTERKNHSINALILFEVLVVVGLMAILVVVLLPALIAANRKSISIGCVGRIKELNLALEIWSVNNGNKSPAQVYATNNALMTATGGGNAWRAWQPMSNELRAPKFLHCPNDRQTGSSTNSDQNFTGASISYFFNPAATNDGPQMILDGDDNIITNGIRVSPGILLLPTNERVGWTRDRHAGNGNVGMADGSVSQLNSNGLNSALAPYGTNSVRWVIP